MWKNMGTGHRITIIVAILIIISLLTFIIVSNFKSENDTNNTKNQSVEEQIEKGTLKKLSGKEEDENRKDAVNAAKDLLNKANEYDGNLTVQQRLEQLEKGKDVDKIIDKKEVDKRLHLIDIYNTDGIKINIYQALITIGNYITTSYDLNKQNNGVLDLNKDSWKKAFVDNKNGIAYVPMNVFYDGESPFSFEMVYNNGEWQLAPYSLLEAIKLSALMQNVKENDSITEK